MQLKPGILVEKTYGPGHHPEGRRPVGIIIGRSGNPRLGEWWLVEWAGNSKREIMSYRYIKPVS